VIALRQRLRSEKFLRARIFTGALQNGELEKFASASAKLIPVIDRPRFRNSKRDRTRTLQAASGLPSSDDQKKWRLRSHLSA
jgi:hypothetical protein